MVTGTAGEHGAERELVGVGAGSEDADSSSSGGDRDRIQRGTRIGVPRLWPRRPFCV